MLPRMGEGKVDFVSTIRAPIGRVFERLSDHEGMAKWPGVGDSRLVKEGTPKNGLGAVRRIKVGGLTLDEEVVLFEPPRAFDYAIIRGLPVNHHLGSVRLSEAEGATEVRWTIRLRSRWPLLAQITALALRRGLPKAFGYLKGELEGAAP